MAIKRKRQTKRSEAEWKAIIKRFAKSGLTIREFCRRERLVQSTFKRWQQNLGEKHSAKFVDLSPAKTPASVSSWELEIRLPNGVQLQFRG